MKKYYVEVNGEEIVVYASTPPVAIRRAVELYRRRNARDRILEIRCDLRRATVVESSEETPRRRRSGRIDITKKLGGGNQK